MPPPQSEKDIVTRLQLDGFTESCPVGQYGKSGNVVVLNRIDYAAAAIRKALRKADAHTLRDILQYPNPIFSHNNLPGHASAGGEQGICQVLFSCASEKTWEKIRALYATCGSKKIFGPNMFVAFRGDSTSEDRPPGRRKARSKDDEIKACERRVAALIHSELKKFPPPGWDPHSPLPDFPFLIRWLKDSAETGSDPEAFRKDVMREVLRTLKLFWEIVDSDIEGWCPK